MSLLRPYIPMRVRFHVLCRQLDFKPIVTTGGIMTRSNLADIAESMGGGSLALLVHMLKRRLAEEQLHCEINDLELDHDPALENREKVFDSAGQHIGYIPDANDPAFLFYRSKNDHYIKTHVRGAYGAQYSDAMLAQRERNRNKPKRKYNWPKRKMQTRKKHD